MEDAHIAQAELTDKKNSLFAVFDGHGGNLKMTQAPRSPPSWSAISSQNCNQTPTTNKTNMNLPSGKLS
jgi:serine/threonine protein phosphatase PrpC